MSDKPSEWAMKKAQEIYPLNIASRECDEILNRDIAFALDSAKKEGVKECLAIVKAADASYLVAGETYRGWGDQDIREQIEELLR